MQSVGEKEPADGLVTKGRLCTLEPTLDALLPQRHLLDLLSAHLKVSLLRDDHLVLSLARPFRSRARHQCCTLHLDLRRR
jgi:hypothetical protein